MRVILAQLDCVNKAWRTISATMSNARREQKGSFVTVITALTQLSSVQATQAIGAR
jgi:hypothetical protein